MKHETRTNEEWQAICARLESERDEARRVALFWHEQACGPFASPEAMPWHKQPEPEPEPVSTPRVE